MDALAVAKPDGANPPVVSRKDRLDRYLSAYWLRPENALWMALRSEALAGVPFDGPSIDVSCGDGVFSFLHHGGLFAPSFDVFQAVARLDDVNTRHADVFDHVDDGYQPVIESAPAIRVNTGTDWKPSLLAKAKRLNLYHELIEHDNEKPFGLPTASFQTVYCNCIYWVKHIDAFLRELRRLCAPGGRIILQIKLDSVLQYTLAKHRAVLGERFLELIGRGRAETWPSLCDLGQWESRCSDAGMTIVKSTPFVTRTHAHIWDIGLRPVAPMLIKMANALTPATRASIKREWVAMLGELLLPLCDPAIDLFGGGHEPAEVQFELTPRA